jgi:hypothetical protein
LLLIFNFRNLLFTKILQFSQLVSEHPTGQSQIYPSLPNLMHVPLLHGLGSHLSPIVFDLNVYT